LIVDITMVVATTEEANLRHFFNFFFIFISFRAESW